LFLTDAETKNRGEKKEKGKEEKGEGNAGEYEEAFRARVHEIPEIGSKKCEKHEKQSTP